MQSGQSVAVKLERATTIDIDLSEKTGGTTDGILVVFNGGDFHEISIDEAESIGAAFMEAAKQQREMSR